MEILSYEKRNSLDRGPLNSKLRIHVAEDLNVQIESRGLVLWLKVQKRGLLIRSYKQFCHVITVRGNEIIRGLKYIYKT